MSETTEPRDEAVTRFVTDFVDHKGNTISEHRAQMAMTENRNAFHSVDRNYRDEGHDVLVRALIEQLALCFEARRKGEPPPSTTGNALRTATHLVRRNTPPWRAMTIDTTGTLDSPTAGYRIEVDPMAGRATFVPGSGEAIVTEGPVSAATRSMGGPTAMESIEFTRAISSQERDRLYMEATAIENSLQFQRRVAAQEEAGRLHRQLIRNSNPLAGPPLGERYEDLPDDNF